MLKRMPKTEGKESVNEWNPWEPRMQWKKYSECLFLYRGQHFIRIESIDGGGLFANKGRVFVVNSLGCLIKWGTSDTCYCCASVPLPT